MLSRKFCLICRDFKSPLFREEGWECYDCLTKRKLKVGICDVCRNSQLSLEREFLLSEEFQELEFYKLFQNLSKSKIVEGDKPERKENGIFFCCDFCWEKLQQGISQKDFKSYLTEWYQKFSEISLRYQERQKEKRENEKKDDEEREIENPFKKEKSNSSFILYSILLGVLLTFYLEVVIINLLKTKKMKISEKDKKSTRSLIF